jgi:hypothetical protein
MAIARSTRRGAAQGGLTGTNVMDVVIGVV